MNILPKTWINRWTETSKVQLEEEDIDFIIKNTAITREQIEQQFEVFITNHPDGRISKKSFRYMTVFTFTQVFYHETFKESNTEKIRS